MKTAKTLLSLLLAAAMCMALLPIGALAKLAPERTVYSGTCGDNLTWTLDTETGVLPGDADGNGVVNANDALAVLRYALLIGGEVDPCADVNGDGVINGIDALAILRMALGLLDDGVIHVTGVEVNPISVFIHVGTTCMLTATVHPSNATDKTVTWSSSNTSVATVSSNGVVTALAPGQAVITVTTADGGYSDTCTINVAQPTVPVTGVEVNPTSLILTVGDTSTLTAIVHPSNATDNTVTWSSTNTGVATVNQNGVVTATGEGTAYIKVKTVDGNYQASCTVTVTETSQEFVHVYYNANGDGATVSPSSIYAKVGSTILNFPVPTWDYHDFQGWYTSAYGGTQVTTPYTVPDHDVTLYAHWQLKSVSDWVPYDQMPAGAQIVQEKWTYTRTTTVETTSSSSPGSGYTLLRTYWRQTGSGSFYYSREFINGYDTDNYYYSYNRDPYTAYENSSSKREVSTGWAGYIYWHWMYDVSYANTTNRAISHRYGYWNADGGTSGGFLYKYFTAIASTVNCEYLDNYYCCSQNLPSYYCHSIITDTTHVGTPRMFRLNYYRCSYTDYEKVYVYQLTENLESSTPVYPSDSISNIVHWVKYRPI